MKKQTKFLKRLLGIGLLSILLIATFSCKKHDSNSSNISTPIYSVGQPVTGDTLQGSIKGTLTKGKTYYVAGNVTINRGDTLLVQPGVKVYFLGNYAFIVRGNLVSVGTKDDQIWFTVQNVTKTDHPGADPLQDPAYIGMWQGFLCDTSCQYLIFKWTHIEFGGGKMGTAPIPGVKNNATAWVITTTNPNGIVVLEDSWIYGSIDDPFRPLGCRMHVMRNTFEKCGFTSGESINIKSGTVGNFAYNVCMGPATNGFKVSNNGGRNPQTWCVGYNNTIINGGYRRTDLGRGGSVNFEEGGRGASFNNLIVNCRYGVRVVGATANYNGNNLVAADTAHIWNGYNLNYNDSLYTAEQIYPVGFYTKPQTTDIPVPSSFLYTGYTIGDTIGTVAAGKTLGLNNPKFVNFSLPEPAPYQTIAYVAGFDFHLQSGSPAIGVGTLGTSTLAPYKGADAVPLDPYYGATEITPPGVDLGAYQTNGTGNQH